MTKFGSPCVVGVKLKGHATMLAHRATTGYPEVDVSWLNFPFQSSELEVFLEDRDFSIMLVTETFLS